MEQKLLNVENKIDIITSRDALLWKDRLVEAHTNAIQKGWCSPAEKERIVQLYDAYIGQGLNSLHKAYKKEIIALPEQPVGDSDGNDKATATAVG